MASELIPIAFPGLVISHRIMRNVFLCGGQGEHVAQYR